MKGNGSDKEEKKSPRDYTPFDVNFRELFTLITGIQARDIHRDLHRIFDALTGHHVSCDDFAKAWYTTHAAVSRQFPEITSWLKSEWGLKEDEEFTDSGDRDKKLDDATLQGIMDRGREKFGDKFSVTPVDFPKGKELLALAMNFMAGLIGERMKSRESDTPFDSGEIDLGNGITAKVMAVPKDVAEAMDEILSKHHRSHLRGKKDHWPN